MNGSTAVSDFPQNKHNLLKFRRKSRPMIRVFGYFVSRNSLIHGLTDFAVLWGAFLFGVLIRFRWKIPTDSSYLDILAMGGVFATVMSLSLMSMGLYRQGTHDRGQAFFIRLTVAYAIGTAALSFVMFLLPSMTIGRGVLALALLSSFFAIILLRVIIARMLSGRLGKRRVLVIGAGTDAQRIANLIDTTGGFDFSILGFLPLPRGKRCVPTSKLVSPRGSLLELAIAEEADEIVIAADNDYRDLPVDDLLDCKLSGFPVFDQVTFFEKEIALIKTDILHPSWLFVSQDGFRIGVTGYYGKRLLDLFLSSVILILATPVLALITIASLIASKGRDPIFYHQTRVGEGNKPFHIVKFRTMRVDAEADGRPRWASRGDSRVTRLGKILRRSRLDELPQLVNVLKGDMSLVGPRPERPEFAQELSEVIPCYAQRHRVKPGLTGWAQLLYPYGSNVEDAKRKLEYDLYYVKHASIIFDIIILIQTVEVVLLGKGAR